MEWFLVAIGFGLAVLSIPALWAVVLMRRKEGAELRRRLAGL